MKNIAIFAALALAVGASAPALADDHHHLIYTPTSGTPMGITTIDFTTSSTLNAVGGYDILGISSDVSGDAITALVMNPGQPNMSTSLDGLWNFDNVYFLTALSLDHWGALFMTASGTEYNLYSNSMTQFALDASVNGSFTTTSLGTAAVPEPASWAMMLGGFGLVGGAMRRRSNSTSVTFA